MARVGAALAETGSAARLVWAHHDLRRLHLSLLGSVIGDGAYATALAVFTYQWGGAGAVGAYAAVRLGLKALTVPFLVAAAERFPPRTALVGLDLLRAVLVAAATLVVGTGGPPLLVLVLAGLSGLVGSPFGPLVAAWTPSLVTSPRELTAANGVGSTVQSVAFFVGPAIGGLLLVVADVPAVFLLDVVTFLWSAVMILGLRTRRTPAADGSDGSDNAEAPRPPREGRLVTRALGGFHAVVEDRRLRLVVGLTCLQTLVTGAAAVFTVVIALQLVDLGEPGVGYLNALLGVGAVAGGLLALGRAGHGTLATDFGAGVLLSTVPVLVVGLAPHPVVAAVVFLVVGVGVPLVDVNLLTLLQRLAPDAVLGRVFGALQSACLAAMALGALVMPLLFAALGPAWGLVALVVPVAAVALACWPALRRLDRALVAPAHLDLVRAQPLFATLPPSAQELLATRLRRLDVPAGTRVIEAGQAGDRFYLIGSGRLDAVRGADQLSEMRAGDCFGEIALLRDVPRTASVVAVEDAVLHTLEREDFLQAVGADPGTASRVELLVSSRILR